MVLKITQEELELEQDRLDNKKQKLAELDDALDAEKKELKGMEMALQKASDHHNACYYQVQGARTMLEKERGKDILICPHCEGEVLLDGDPPKLIKDVSLSHHEAEMKKLENIVEECEENAEDAHKQYLRVKEERDFVRSKHDKYQFEIDRTRQDIREIEDFIDKHKDKIEVITDTTEEDMRDVVGELESQIERLQRSILIKEAYAQAKEIHAEIVLNENIAYRLSP